MSKDFEGISELSSRSGNGIDVARLWQRCDNTAVVTVVDHHSGEAFVLNVHENDDVLDMFHHPYAYALFLRFIAPRRGPVLSPPPA